MKSRSRLYDAFGALIYTVSLADGMIQPEELDKIHEVLMNDPWG
ncbi:MAG: tellurite resistance protein [Paraglaciecola sp.]|jgi:tellurite resistance protein